MYNYSPCVYLITSFLLHISFVLPYVHFGLFYYQSFALYFLSFPQYSPLTPFPQLFNIPLVRLTCSQFHNMPSIFKLPAFLCSLLTSLISCSWCIQEFILNTISHFWKDSTKKLNKCSIKLMSAWVMIQLDLGLVWTHLVLQFQARSLVLLWYVTNSDSQDSSMGGIMEHVTWFKRLRLVDVAMWHIALS